MGDFVLDSYAMLAFFRNEKGAEKASKLLHEAAKEKYKLYMTCINAGEVFYMTYRKENSTKAEIAWKALQQFPIHIVEAGMELAFAAAKLKARHSISYADAFAAALTISKKAILITGDREFDALVKEPNFKVSYL